ncbi:MAG: DNA polymerase III subunit delta [Firmicutes bacterium]|nr:DNA polymerase III subunit delta [Bacillota bacterium]
MWQQKEHAYRRIQSELNEGKIPGVVLLYGREQYLVDWAIERMLSTYVNPATKTMDYTLIDEDDLTDQSFSDAVIAAAETIPLFSEKKVVVARGSKVFTGDTGRDAEKIAEYIVDVPNTTILIFRTDEINAKKKLPAAISKYGRIYEFDGLPREDLSSFVAKRFKASETDVSRDVMRIIIEETGYFNRDSDYNLYALNNDVTKMIALAKADAKAGSHAIVTEAIARQTIEGDVESSAIDFINYLCSGEKNKAFKLLNNILDEDNDAYRLIGLMVSQFELILGIREMQDAKVIPSVIQSKLGLPKWRYDKLRPFADKMSREKLRSLLIKIYEIDRNIKTGNINGKLAVEMIIAEV